MKNISNIPFPHEPVRWKKDEWAIHINHSEVNTEEGIMYEADFTVIKELSAEAALNAFTRQQVDPELDYAAINTIEVNGKLGIDIEVNYEQKVSANIFPPLPASGWLKEGVIYSYGNGAVMVRQPHERTVYAPELTPALFSFYRENTEGQEWIPNEPITINATRIYEGKTYKCIKPHTSQVDWTPLLTLGVLWEEVQQQQEQPPQWVSAEYYKYVVGFEVYDSGKVWKAKNTTHTWIQPALEGNGAISWEYVKDWV